MRILIVEDDRKLAHQLKKGMEEQGHVVAVQLEGTAGLEAAIRSQFDVLVLDVMLPGLDGFSIVRRLRAARNATPILLLTVTGYLRRYRHGTRRRCRRLLDEAIFLQGAACQTPSALQT